MHIIRHLPKRLIMVKPALWGRVKLGSNTPFWCILPNLSLVRQPKVDAMTTGPEDGQNLLQTSGEWFFTFTQNLGILKNKGCVHCGLAIYIKKYLTAKEELWRLKYFTMQTNNLQKNPLKETKIIQVIITVFLISSFNTSQNIIFQKSSYKNRPIN